MQIPDGWTLHFGDECPVDASTVVVVFMRIELVDGWVTKPSRASNCDWTSEQVDGDIIAYKVMGEVPNMANALRNIADSFPSFPIDQRDDDDFGAEIVLTAGDVRNIRAILARIDGVPT